MFATWLGRIWNRTPHKARPQAHAGQPVAGRVVNGVLDLSRDPHLEKLPSGIHCDRLNVSGTNIEWLPPDLQVRQEIDASNCRRLRYVPALSLIQLDSQGCRSLTTLPDGLHVERLNISDCPQLTEIPIGLGRRLTHLIARNCKIGRAHV